MIHACPTAVCRCFPSYEFQLRPEIQQLLCDGEIQTVVDLWVDERESGNGN